MPTNAQIENADPLTAEQSIRLIAALRSCSLYALNRALYPDVASLVTPYIDDDSDTSRLLSAVEDVVFKGGLQTVAVTGGKDAVEYSATAQRETELALALDALIDRPVGAVGFGSSPAFGSFNLKNQAVW